MPEDERRTAPSPAPPTLFHNLQQPSSYSSTGRYTASRLYSPTLPAPMLYGAGCGLVLYERVIAHNQEKQMVNRLSVPKSTVQVSGCNTRHPPAKCTQQPSLENSQKVQVASFPPHKIAESKVKQVISRSNTSKDYVEAALSKQHVFTWGGRIPLQRDPQILQSKRCNSAEFAGRHAPARL